MRNKKNIKNPEFAGDLACKRLDLMLTFRNFTTKSSFFLLRDILNFLKKQYPGSIVDISQLQYMLKKAEGYGYKKVGFILDRGYFGRENIQHMDECGYDFVIMVKGMSESVRRVILENK